MTDQYLRLKYRRQNYLHVSISLSPEIWFVIFQIVYFQSPRWNAMSFSGTMERILVIVSNCPCRLQKSWLLRIVWLYPPAETFSYDLITAELTMCGPGCASRLWAIENSNMHFCIHVSICACTYCFRCFAIDTKRIELLVFTYIIRRFQCTKSCRVRCVYASFVPSVITGYWIQRQ